MELFSNPFLTPASLPVTPVKQVKRRLLQPALPMQQGLNQTRPISENVFPATALNASAFLTAPLEPGAFSFLQAEEPLVQGASASPPKARPASDDTLYFLDVDNDKQLSRADREVKAANLDTNKDGEVSDAELKAGKALRVTKQQYMTFLSNLMQNQLQKILNPESETAEERRKRETTSFRGLR